MIQSSPNKIICSYSLPTHIALWIDAYARETSVKKSALVEQIIGEYIKAELKKNRIGTRHIDPIKED